MYLTAMTHRDELFDLTLRWMNDDFHPDDGEKITRIFVYESAVSAMVIDRIIRFLKRLFDLPIHAERIRTKHLMRRKILDRRPSGSPRMDALADDYLLNTEYFFPWLPMDALIITGPDSRLLSLGRIKRLSRVAEKVSYRLVDALFREIQAQARVFAEIRAAAAGVPFSRMISSPAEMEDDFAQAEAAVARRFKDKNVRIEPESLIINDIIGFKIIGEPEFLDRVPLLLGQEPGITVTEIQKHTGRYNAVNLLADMELPARKVLTEHLRSLDWSISRGFGLNPALVSRHISDYAEQGAGTVRAELILTTYEELMESEFGRSMHELRILRLRQRQNYCGILGQNAGYLIEYLLALASSPTVSVPEIPIKMYGRYLPETIAALKCALHGNNIDAGLLSTFCLRPDCPGQFCTGVKY